MQREHLDASAAVELLRRQEALQAEAYQLIGHLDLFTMLSHAGKPEQIGSSVSGLMVWRDLDFNVLCSHRDLRTVFKTMQPLLANPQVTKLHYSNESQGHAPAERQGDERYYFVTFYDAVLEHGVRTPAQFKRYLLERGMPIPG
jgi:hypothetical protein